MSDFHIDKLAVVGVGLIGGSLSLALKERIDAGDTLSDLEIADL